MMCEKCDNPNYKPHPSIEERLDKIEADIQYLVDNVHTLVKAEHHLHYGDKIWSDFLAWLDEKENGS